MKNCCIKLSAYICTPWPHHCTLGREGLVKVQFQEKTMAARTLWPSTHYNSSMCRGHGIHTVHTWWWLWAPRAHHSCPWTDGIAMFSMGFDKKIIRHGMQSSNLTLAFLTRPGPGKVEIVCATANQNPSFCLHRWNPCKFASRGNQSIHLTWVM